MKSHDQKRIGIDAGLLRQLAVEAQVDPRTIRRAYRGESVKGMSGERARAVLRLHGLTAEDGPRGKGGNAASRAITAKKAVSRG